MVDRVKSDTEKSASAPRPRTRKFLGFLPGSGWVWGAAVLTIGYLGYAYFYLWPQPVIGPCSPGQVEHLGVCLAPNEVGDLFAGLFAPIAFLWLVVAVLVQAQELKTQRDELKLTREEMEAQRKEMASQRQVWEAQLAETRAQTRALTVEGDERKQAHADRQLDVLLGGIVRTVANDGTALSFDGTYPSKDAGKEVGTTIAFHTRPAVMDNPTTDDDLLVLSNLALRISALEQFEKIEKITPVNADMFDLVLTAMDSIDTIAGNLSESAKFRLDVVRYSEFQRVMRQLATLVER